MGAVSKIQSITGVNVSIHKCKDSGYMVAMVVNGKRHRSRRPTLELAEERQREWLSQLDYKGDFTERQLTEFRLCMSMLDGVPILDAVQFYLERHKCSLPLNLLYERMAEAKKSYLSEKGFISMEMRAKPWLKRFGERPLSDITVVEMDRFLNETKNPTTRAGYRQLIVMLSRWAVKKNYLPEGMTEAEKTETVRIPKTDVKFLSADSLEKFLNWCVEHRPSMVGYFAVRAFTGIRTAEAERIKPRNFVGDRLNLTVEQTKTGRSRSIPIPANLQEWLRAHPFKPLTPVQACHAMQDAPVNIPRNGFRKGFVSHAMAKHENAPLVSTWAGHSVGVLENNYKGIVSPEQGSRWFEIYPR